MPSMRSLSLYLSLGARGIQLVRLCLKEKKNGDSIDLTDEKPRIVSIRQNIQTRGWILNSVPSSIVAHYVSCVPLKRIENKT